MSSALRTFLNTITGVRVAGSCSDLSQILLCLDITHPDMMLLDADLVDNQYWSDFLIPIRHIRPNIYCIALVNDLEQMEVARQAGVSQVILKGFLDQHLHQTITGVRPTRPIPSSPSQTP